MSDIDTSLWGNPGHLWYLEQELRAQHPKDQLYILTATRNAGSFTYDGIETGGERVTAEIEETLEELQRQGQDIKKISIIGYSLGGLVARYAAGLLFSKGWFDKLQPVNFTTFASPHLGVRSPLLGFHNHIWNVVGARTLSMSGRQLFTIDRFRDTGRPLLSVMADPNSIFVRALSSFKNRSLYANIINDRSVVYYSAGISRIDPFVNMREIKLNYVPEYSPVILDHSNMVSRRDETEPLPAFRERLMQQTTSHLAKLPTYLFIAVFVPIGIILYLTSALVQNFRSAQRIRDHESGSTTYRVKLLMNDMRRTAEEVFEGVNNTHDLEYLPENPSSSPRPKHGRKSSLSAMLSEKVNLPDEEAPQNSDDNDTDANSEDSTEYTPLIKKEIAKTKASKSEIGTAAEFPTLALTKEQFAMIDSLDAVGFKKYPVHISSATHAHAAIIMRMDKESFKEGKVVAKHWLERFEL